MTHPDVRGIEAVVYDVDGTLYRLRAMRVRMALQLAAALAARPRATWRAVKVLRVYRKAQEALRSRAAPAPTGGDPQLAAAAEALHVPPESIQPIVEEWISRRPLAILKRCRRPAVLKAVRALHEAGVPQGVYSDYPAGDKLAALGVADCIDAVVFSAQAEVGCYKPAPNGFRRAAEMLGVPPERCAYVGDRPEVDGAGARAAGMTYIDVTEIASPQALLRRVAAAGARGKPRR